MVHTILNINFPNNNYQKAICNKYALSIHITDKGTYNYSGFNTFFEIEHFLNNVRKSSIIRKCLFEVIKTDKEVKPYFDIDNMNFTRTKYDMFLQDFIMFFNLYFKTNITIDDLLIYIRDDKENTENIKSSHIIIHNYKLNFKVIENFILYFDLVTDNKYSHKELIIRKIPSIKKNDLMSDNNKVEIPTDDIYITKSIYDKAIYTKNRTFNLPYNTKLKYITENIENPKYFIPYKEQLDSVKDYFISYTDHLITKPLKKNGAFKLIEIFSRSYEKSFMSQMKNAFDKMKNHNTIITQIEQVIIKNINFNCITETIEHLINYLPPSFYFENKEWIIVTTILKKNGLNEFNVKKWLNYSSLITNNKWSYETNDIWYKNMKGNKYGIPKFLSIINLYLQDKPINFYTDTDLVKYIQTKLSINKIDLIDVLEKNKFIRDYAININTFHLNEINKYNFSTGFLYENETIIGNYYYDNELKKLHQDTKLNNTIEINEINDMKQIAVNFVTNNDTFLSCKAKWGAGKTFIIVKSIFEEAIINNKRLIFITENNSLNKKYSDDFHIQSHINNNNIDHSKSIACSTESIQKIHITNNDILILDEYESIISHYESETFKGNEFAKFLNFKDIIKKANKIVLLDADLSNDRINLLSQMKDKIKIITHDIKTNNFKDYKFNIYVNENSFINTIIKECLKPNNKVIIPSSSKKFNIDMINEIHNRDKTKTILKIDSDGVLLIKNSNHTTNIKFDNLEQFIIEQNVDAFFYSPSIKTGISINTEYFNKCYGYAHCKSCNAREFIQMLFRARNLIDKEINIGFSSYFSRIKQFIDKEQISKFILNPIMIYYSQRIFNGNYEITTDDTMKHITLDSDFYNLSLINEQENYNSSSRFNQDFILRLKYNHNIDINYIDNNVMIDDVELTDLIVNEKMEAFINCELVNLEQYQNLTDDDWLKKQKYRFFYETYFIEGITDTIIPNEVIYEAINNEYFYEKYFNKAIYKSYKSIKFTINDDVNKTALNKTIMDIKEEQTYNLEYAKTENIKLIGIERKVVKHILLIQLLDHLDIDLLKIPFITTNKEWFKKITQFKFNGFLKILENYYTKYELETKFNFSTSNDKKYNKNMSEIIKSLLSYFKIEMKYLNRHHTTKETDKIIFCYDNFNSVKKVFVGRLKPICHFKIRADKAVKTRGSKNTFQYKNEITDTFYKCYKTQNINYFNTYETQTTYELKKLTENVTIQGDLTTISFCSIKADNIIKALHDEAVLIELTAFFYNKAKPKIISDNQYKLIQIDKVNLFFAKDEPLILNNIENSLWVEKLNEVKEKYTFIWSDGFTKEINKMLLTDMDYDDDFELLFYQTDKSIKLIEIKKLQKQKDNDFLHKLREIYNQLNDFQIAEIETHILSFVKEDIYLNHTELERLINSENKPIIILKLNKD